MRSLKTFASNVSPAHPISLPTDLQVAGTNAVNPMMQYLARGPRIQEDLNVPEAPAIMLGSYKIMQEDLSGQNFHYEGYLVDLDVNPRAVNNDAQSAAENEGIDGSPGFKRKREFVKASVAVDLMLADNTGVLSRVRN